MNLFALHSDQRQKILLNNAILTYFNIYALSVTDSETCGLSNESSHMSFNKNYSLSRQAGRDFCCHHRTTIQPWKKSKDLSLGHARMDPVVQSMVHKHTTNSTTAATQTSLSFNLTAQAQVKTELSDKKTIGLTAVDTISQEHPHSVRIDVSWIGCCWFMAKKL